jgi:long-chain acyl-CoA synthetase
MISNELLASFSEHVAVISDDGGRLKYKELLECSQELVGEIEQRSLVFCMTKNTLGSFLGYIAFITNNIVPLMLDSELDQQLLDNLIARYHPDYLWISNKKVNYINMGKLVNSKFGYSLIKLNCKTTYLIHNELCLLLTTSGSTGSQKLVKLSYENIYSNAESISNYLTISDQDRPITSLPMHYSFCLSIINSHIIKGATILLTNKSLIEKKFWLFFQKHKATSLSGVPYTFEILNKIHFIKMDLTSLKEVTQAGGRLNDNINREISEFCHRTGIKFFIMYGQTEATARISYLPYEDSIKKLGSIGKSIPGGKLSLIDDYGNVINEYDEEGELVYKGKNVSLGYSENIKDLSLGDENKGVLFTGDIAKRDRDGYYYITGRKTRFIKLFGHRISLDEIENLLKNLLTDCACIGKNDDEIIIFITDSKMKDQTVHYISNKTKINSRAFSIRVTNEIPKNSYGKTIYSQLI